MPYQCTVHLTGPVCNVKPIQTKSGTAMTRFTIVYKNWRDKKDGGEIEPTYVNCIAFKVQAEWVAELEGQKGHHASVIGTLKTNKWQDKETMEVVCNDVAIFKATESKSGDVSSPDVPF